MKRLTIEFDGSIAIKMEQLKTDTKSPDFVEVIRRALAVYEFAVDTKLQGGKIIRRLHGVDKEVEIK